MLSEHFSVRFMDAGCTASCPACGGPPQEGPGPRLFSGEQVQPLCRGCSKRLAPDLSALLELAATAERIGRHGRHLLTPSMVALLDLACAAENYATAAQARAAVG